MATRDAASHRGQLRLEVAGDPFAVSICNCLACQRRTGSAFDRRAMARPEPDFDPIRDEPAFQGRRGR